MAEHSARARRGFRAGLLPLALMCSSAATAHPVDHWSREIANASARFQLPASWIRRVMRAESGGEPLLRGTPLVSRAGAIGLMQLMPATWRDMRRLLGLGDDPANPADNILAGAGYLKLMYLRFGYPGLFAAYNAGPARYTDFVSRSRRLPRETRDYVAEIAERLGSVRVRTTPESYALFVVAKSGQGGAGPTFAPRAAAIFVALAGTSRR